MGELKEKPLIIGISGVSSSGKTTLSRHLRDIWPGTFILHEDDFYWPDKDIPVIDGIQDWDCLQSLDLAKLRSCLEHIRATGTSPPSLVSKEDQNSVGESVVLASIAGKWKQEAQELLGPSSKRPIAIIDGFLLFSEQMAHIWQLFDVRLFLRTSYATAKRRREARAGYVTIEGFWEDPPGYVDKVVLPNYVKDHAFLFEDGNVDGQVDELVRARMNLQIMPKALEEDMTKCLDWACSIIRDHIVSTHA